MENLRKVIDGIEYIEEWKDIDGFDGCYQISSFGRVKSLKCKSETVLKTQMHKKGYEAIRLGHKSKKYYIKIHRLVAVYYVSNPNNLPQVNHKDEIKTNNFYLNLEWMTNRDNCNYSRNKRAASKYPGVGWHKGAKKWMGYCQMNGKRHYLGLYKEEINAAQAYICFCAIHNLE